MVDVAPEPHVLVDARGVVQLMSDGTVRRSTKPPFTVRVPDDECGVEWRDVTYDAGNDAANARLYRHSAANESESRLPVVAYFHGGGFCIGSGRWPNFHAWCLRLAAELPAIVISFDYRLAPEHRLPAPQEDGAKAMEWLRACATTDPWLADAADFSRVFMAGDSAGGNIVHHMAVRFGKTGLGPQVQLRGYVLFMPAMAGETRTPAELESRPDWFFSAEASEKYLKLILPEGTNVNSPVLNLAGPQAPGLEAVAMAPMLVVAAEYDVLRDLNKHYARRMKHDWGKDVEFVLFAEQQHCFFGLHPWSAKSDELVRLVRSFVVKHLDSE